MAIRAVVFDIGGVLEITRGAPLGRAVGDAAPTAARRTARSVEVWRGGSVGALGEAEVERRTADILGFDQARLDAFMADIWAEYLGTLNVELDDYFASLRSRCRTGHPQQQLHRGTRAGAGGLRLRRAAATRSSTRTKSAWRSPDPAHLRPHLQRLDVRPGASISSWTMSRSASPPRTRTASAASSTGTTPGRFRGNRGAAEGRVTPAPAACGRRPLP